MARRNRPVRRQHRPDPRFNDIQVQIFINKVMRAGKKSIAERIVYKAFAQVEERTGKDPVEIRPERRIALAMRWLLEGTRGRSGKNTAEKLANELIDASNNTGAAIKRRDDTHRMADANRAFAHYRW
jgi:small subunit ribosomal protein S7